MSSIGAGTSVPLMSDKNGTEVPTPQGYKQTKVGVVPEDWDVVKLGDISSRITTKNRDNLIDMVFTNSAIKGIVIQNEFFDKDIANKGNLTGYYIVKSGDFVYNPRISKHAPSGPINRNRHEFSGIVSPLYTVFSTNDNEIIDYLEYFFSSTLWFRYMKAIANYGARHDRMNITNNDFMKMPILYPPKVEQKKIANILTTWDDAISTQDKLIKAKEELKKGLMQKLLSGEVRVSGFGAGTLVPSQPNGAGTLVPLIGDKNGTEVPTPSGWKIVKLGDVADINPKNNELPKSFIYIDLESVKNGILLKESKILKENAPSRAQRLLEKNDILYQTVRPYQKNNFFFNLTGNYVASTGYAQIRALESSEYLYHYLHWHEFVSKVLLRCTGTSYPAINSTDLAKIKLTIPPLKEQQKIAQILSLADEEIDLLKNELVALKEQRRGLMQKLLTGVVRVEV